MLRAVLLALVVLLAGAATAPAAIHAPAGVRISVAATGVPFATNLAFDPTGGLWITSGAGGPQPTDGVWHVPRGATRARHVVKGLPTALGLTWHAGVLYVAHITSPSNGRVLALSGWRDGRFATRRAAVPRLRIGRHTVDSIVPGPDGRLYLGVGSVYDNRGPSGRVVSFRPGGGGLRTEATGLRNPYGLAFLPGTSILLVTDNGRDDLGAMAPPEELNAFDVTAPVPDFGFPGCYGQGGAPCSQTVHPLLDLPVHASSDGLAVSEDWGGGGLTAFVAQNGSSFPAKPTGNDVRIVRLGEGAVTASERRFAWGFEQRDPLGAAIGPDGALYVTLFLSGKVVRFSPPR